MREMRFIAAVVVAGFVIVLGALAWSMFAPGSNSMDRTATRHIEQVCGFKALCKVRVGDLSTGDWDTFYEFGTGVSQADIDRVVGSGRVRAGDLRRTLVLTRGGRVVLAEHEKTGVDGPLDGEIVFARSPDAREELPAMVRYAPDDWLRVTMFQVKQGSGRGTYYVLSPEDRHIDTLPHSMN